MDSRSEGKEISRTIKQDVEEILDKPIDYSSGQEDIKIYHEQKKFRPVFDRDNVRVNTYKCKDDSFIQKNLNNESKDEIREISKVSSRSKHRESSNSEQYRSHSTRHRNSSMQSDEGVFRAPSTKRSKNRESSHLKRKRSHSRRTPKRRKYDERLSETSSSSYESTSSESSRHTRKRESKYSTPNFYYDPYNYAYNMPSTSTAADSRYYLHQAVMYIFRTILDHILTEDGAM